MAEYDTIVLSRPEFVNPICLVANCFIEQVVTGNKPESHVKKELQIKDKKARDKIK